MKNQGYIWSTLLLSVVLVVVYIRTQLHTGRLFSPQEFDPPLDVLPLLHCPAGDYLTGPARALASEKLRAHWRGLRRLGYVSQAAHPGAAARARGFVTYEDPIWPKPPMCRDFWLRNAAAAKGRRRRAPRLVRVPPRPPGTCEPNGTTCDKWRISRTHRFIWHHVWKVRLGYNLKSAFLAIYTGAPESGTCTLNRASTHSPRVLASH